MNITYVKFIILLGAGIVSVNAARCEVAETVVREAVAEACEILLKRTGFSDRGGISFGDVRRLAAVGNTAQITQRRFGITLTDSSNLYFKDSRIGFWIPTRGGATSCFLFGEHRIIVRFDKRQTIALSYAVEAMAKEGATMEEIDQFVLPVSPTLADRNLSSYDSRKGRVGFTWQDNKFVVRVENRETGKTIINAAVKFRPGG
jgi:hypothetical protein